MVDTLEGKKKKRLVDYHYDLGSCTFCDLCVTNCPTGAIQFSNDFEQAVFTRDKLKMKLNAAQVDDPEPTPEQVAAAKAALEAKIAAAKAAAEAKKAAAAANADGAPKTDNPKAE